MATRSGPHQRSRHCRADEPGAFALGLRTYEEFGNSAECSHEDTWREVQGLPRSTETATGQHRHESCHRNFLAWDTHGCMGPSLGYVRNRRTGAVWYNGDERLRCNGRSLFTYPCGPGGLEPRADPADRK